MTLPKPYYQDSLVTLYQGDALFLLPEISGADLIIADPPYSSGGAMRSDRMTSVVDKYVNSDCKTFRLAFSGDNRDQRSYLAWSTLWMSFALQSSHQAAHIVCFTDWRQLPTTTDAIQAGGWVWRGIGTWWKPGIRMQRGGLSSSAEYVVWGTCGSWDRDNSHAPQNVIRAAGVRDKDHIAEKPEAVMDWLVPFAPVGGLVVDPFCGIGTSLVAARKHGRRAIGIELDEFNCQQAAIRLGQQSLPFFAEAAP